jgi:hypothetical protein
MFERIEAQFLRPGDRTRSNEEVLNVTLKSLSLPAGRVAVTIRQKGKNRMATWNKRTEITVERKA